MMDPIGITSQMILIRSPSLCISGEIRENSETWQVFVTKTQVRAVDKMVIQIVFYFLCKNIVGAH